MASRWSMVSGLSPRGRGNPGVESFPEQDNRSIPAWAGEPILISLRPVSASVYPRVGGGTAGGSLDSKCAAGLSPRGRGNLLAKMVLLALLGSIPAWAGEPCH